MTVDMELEKVQVYLGCPDCRFVEKENIGITDACKHTYGVRPGITGRCMRKTKITKEGGEKIMDTNGQRAVEVKIKLRPELYKRLLERTNREELANYCVAVIEGAVAFERKEKVDVPRK